MKMKQTVYSYGKKYNKAIVTVCLMKKYDNTFARGISLCSKKDCPKDNTGLNKAIGRATKALERKKSDLPINRDEAIRLLFEAEAPPFKYKAEYKPQLTEYEKELMG